MSKSPRDLLRTLALKHSGVEEGIACKGTAVESSAFKVGKKTFLFARDLDMRLKLQESLAEAEKHASQDPSQYSVGAGGWILVKFGSVGVPPRELLTRWVDESYRIMAGGAAPAGKKATARKKTKR
jgi:hypothetical protein